MGTRWFSGRWEGRDTAPWWRVWRGAGWPCQLSPTTHYHHKQKTNKNPPPETNFEDPGLHCLSQALGLSISPEHKDSWPWEPHSGGCSLHLERRLDAGRQEGPSLSLPLWPRRVFRPYQGEAATYGGHSPGPCLLQTPQDLQVALSLGSSSQLLPWPPPATLTASTWGLSTAQSPSSPPGNSRSVWGAAGGPRGSWKRSTPISRVSSSPAWPRQAAAPHSWLDAGVGDTGPSTRGPTPGSHSKVDTHHSLHPCPQDRLASAAGLQAAGSVSRAGRTQTCGRGDPAGRGQSPS